MILLLVAHDPDEDIRTEVRLSCSSIDPALTRWNKAAFFLTSRARRLPIAARQAQLEHPFVRLIHLLAHHPDFSGDANAVDEIKEMAKYVPSPPSFLPRD
jgi:sister-chromatid-cohesion protein PDS5